MRSSKYVHEARLGNSGPPVTIDGTAVFPPIDLAPLAAAAVAASVSLALLRDAEAEAVHRAMSEPFREPFRLRY